MTESGCMMMMMVVVVVVGRKTVYFITEVHDAVGLWHGAPAAVGAVCHTNKLRRLPTGTHGSASRGGRRRQSGSTVVVLLILVVVVWFVLYVPPLI